MNAEDVRVDSEHFSAVAVLSGRSKQTLRLYRLDNPADPVRVTEIRVASETDRDAFISPLAVETHEELRRLLTRLAAECANRQAQAKPSGTRKRSEVDPFPAIEPWADEVDGAILLEDVVKIVRRYVVLPAPTADAIALWIVHTYCIEIFDFTPYLAVVSPVRECGKTTLLEMMLHLAYRAQLTGGITAAALYRRVDRHRPTMLLDELDSRLRGDGGELLRGVLNTGFSREGKVTICVGDDHEDRDFATFCPKVLAGIGRLWDTVTSRSIPIRMRRATREEFATIGKIRGDRIKEECSPYQRRLLRWVEDNRSGLRVTDPVTPTALGARQCDVWRPLLSIADLVGGRWPDAARSAAFDLHGIAEAEGDLGLLMLADLRNLFEGEQTDGLPSEFVVQELAKREDRPWPEYRHDKPISTRGIASLLGRFDVKPRTIRVAPAFAARHGTEGETAKGYRIEDLATAFRTYLQEAPMPLMPSVTSVTPTPDRAPVTDVTDRNTGVPRAPVPDAPGAYETDERLGIMADR